MARKRKKPKASISPREPHGGKVKTGELVANVKQLIAARIAEKFAEEPEKFAKLTELGLVDEATLRSLPEDLDFAGMLKQFRDRIAEMAATEPSVLEQLEVRPLEMFTQADELPTTSTQVSLAVVFCDLEGFTGYTSANGDLEASALLRDHYDTVESIVRGRGGTVVKTIGDGHMLGFGEPRAAVLGGLELADVEAGPLRVRVGGHNGEVVKMPGDILGHVVNVAARITDLAAGGQSLVTTSLRDAAGAVQSVEFEAPTLTRLRGIDDPLEICRARHL